MNCSTIANTLHKGQVVAAESLFLCDAEELAESNATMRIHYGQGRLFSLRDSWKMYAKNAINWTSPVYASHHSPPALAPAMACKDYQRQTTPRVLGKCRHAQ